MHAVKPCPLFFLGEDRRLHGEQTLPVSVAQNVHILRPDVDIDGVVAVCAAHALLEGQVQDLRCLAEIPVVRLLSGKACAVDTGLLSCADADSLPVDSVADGVGLGVLQGDQGHQKVLLRLFRDVLVLGDDVVQHRHVDVQLVSALLEGDAEDLLALHRIRTVSRVDLDHVVVSVLFLLQDLQCLRLISRSDHAVGDLALDQLRGGDVAGIRQGNEVAEAGHTVRAAGTGIGAGQRAQFAGILDPVDLLQNIGKGSAAGSTCRGDMLEGSRGRKAGGLLQLADQLPAVKGVQKIDIAGTSAEDGQREFGTVRHINAGRLLVRIAAVL